MQRVRENENIDIYRGNQVMVAEDADRLALTSALIELIMKMVPTMQYMLRQKGKSGVARIRIIGPTCERRSRV